MHVEDTEIEAGTPFSGHITVHKTSTYAHKAPIPIQSLCFAECDLSLWCIPPGLVQAVGTPLFLPIPRLRLHYTGNVPKMMGDGEDERYRRYLAELSSRAPPAAQSFNHQHQHQHLHLHLHPHSAYGDFLDPNNTGDARNSVNSPSAHQRLIGDLQRELADVPSDSYGNTRPPPSEIVAPTSLTIITQRKSTIRF